MATVELRPNGVHSTAGSPAVVGAATHHEAQADSSDVTYTELDGGGESVLLACGTFAFPALSQIRSAYAAVRVRTTTDSPLNNEWDFRLFLDSGGTTYFTAGSAPLASTTWTTFNGPVITTNPRNGGAWTQADIDGLGVYENRDSAAVNPYRFSAASIFVAYNEAPVTTVTGPASATTNTLTPTVTWTYSDPEGDAQERYQVKVFSAAQYSAGGFNPETSTPTWSSGEVTSSATSRVTGALTVNTTYRAYVKTADTGSGGRYGNWAYSQFTVNLSPNAPTLSGPTGTVLAGSKTLSWTFNDSGDTQGSYAVRRKIGSGAYEYWNGSAWGPSEVQNTGSASSIAASFTGQTSAWSWSVKTWDAAGQAGPYATDASFVVHDAPTVTISTPTAGQVVSSGGPDLTVSWAYAQAQSVAQATYRVRFLNDAGTTTYHDTGVLSGTVGSKVFDLVALGIPTDTTDIKITVDVTSSDTFAGTATNAFDVLWGVVTATITGPADGTVLTSTPVTVSWSFSSTRGFAQGCYRVRLLQGANSLFDTGFVPSTASSLVLPYVLTDNSSYTIGVQLKNTQGAVS